MREIINQHYLNFQHVNNVSPDERYYVAGYSGGTLTVHTNGALVLVPLLMPFRARIDRIGVRVRAGAAGTGRIGIYNTTSAINLRPAELVMDSGIIDLSTTGFKTAVVDQLLKAATLYWVGIVTSDNPDLTGISAADLFPILGFDNTFDETNAASTAWFATGLSAGDVLPFTVVPVLVYPFTVAAIAYRLAA